MRGSAPTPNRKFMKALNKFRDYQLKNAQILRSSTNSTFIVAPKVVPIQEYHTSQICRECHITKLNQTRARECGIFGGNKKLWGVKECDLCWVRWNRDISAAFNMLYLYVYQSFSGGRRPEGFYVSAS